MTGKVRIYKDQNTNAWWADCPRCLVPDRAPTHPVAVQRASNHIALHQRFGFRSPQGELR